MAQVVSKKCAVCGENNSKLLCYECNQELCEICQPVHDKFSGNKQHTIVDTREVTWLNYAEKLKCKTHDQDNRCFCLTCRSFICAECIIEEHKSHDVKSVKSIACDYRMDLSKTELKVKGEMEMLFNLKTQIKKKKKTLKDAFDLVERDLQSCIHDVQDIVQGEADEYIATTKKHLIKQEVIGDSELLQVEMTENGYKTFIRTLTELKKEKHDGSFVTRFMWIQDDMENLREMPSVQSEEGLNSFDRSAFLSTISNEINSRAEGLKDLQKSKELKHMLKLKEEEVIKSNHTCDAVLKELDVLRENQIKIENENIILKYENGRLCRLLQKPENDIKRKYRQKKADYRKLKTDKEELQKRCDAILKELDVLREHQSKIENKNIILKMKIERLREKPANDIKQKFRQVEADNRNLKTDKDELQKRFENMQHQQTVRTYQYNEIQLIVKTLKDEKESLMHRLSMVAGMKMKDNNPAIIDLSDTNRPEKLSEKFREIYDNSWTNLLDAIIEKTGDSDDIGVKQIVSALTIMYGTCKTTITNNRREVAKLVGYPEDCFDKPYSGGKEGHDPVLQTLKDLIQVSVTRQSESVTKNIKELPEIKTILQVGGKNADAFITECLQLCLYMCTQDPPVVLDFSCKSGDAFDKEKFTPFTKSGAIVDYLVWPVMYLSDNGALMSKGIAEGK